MSDEFPVGGQRADFDTSDSDLETEHDRNPLTEGVVPMGAALGGVVSPDIAGGRGGEDADEIEKDAREHGAP
jgi:hypothetical protein